MKKGLVYLEKNLDALLLLGGCGAVVYGLALWNDTAAWVAAGIFMIGFAFLIGSVKSNESAE